MKNFTVVLKDGTRHEAVANTPQDAIREVGASSTEVKYVSEKRNWEV